MVVSGTDGIKVVAAAEVAADDFQIEFCYPVYNERREEDGILPE